MSHDQTNPPSTSAHSTPHDGTPTTATTCCPVSAADEFSYRNPWVLGESLVSAGRTGIDYALEGDHERTVGMLSWLAERTADAEAFDDHTQRHLVQGICSALRRAIAYAEYTYANPLTDTDDDPSDYSEDYPHDCESDAPSESQQPHAHTSHPAPHARIRIHRPRTQPVTPFDNYADTPDTTQEHPHTLEPGAAR